MLQEMTGLLLLLQTGSAQVTGVVRDGHTGAPLIGAHIALADLGRHARSDSSGRYRLDSVPAGSHRVIVRTAGFGERVLNALVPSVGLLEIDVTLVPRPYRLPGLDVSSGFIAVRGSERDSTFGADRIAFMATARYDPLLPEPDAFQILSGGPVAIAPEAPSGVHLRGGAADHTGYLLDGIPVFNPYHAAGVFSAWNPDALDAVRVYSMGSAPDHPAVLSGAVSAATRAPSPEFWSAGGISSTQARLSFNAPLGSRGAGLLVSLRSTLPDALAPAELSYLHGRASDWLGKIEVPALGGRVRALGYGNNNAFAASSTVESEATPDSTQNSFEWFARSFGLEYLRASEGNSLRVLAWSASTRAGLDWAGAAIPEELSATRRDVGVLARIEGRSGGRTTAAGLRLEHSGTDYDVHAGPTPVSTLASRMVLVTAFAEHARPLAADLTLRLSLSVTGAEDRAHAAPAAELRWQASPTLSLNAGYRRANQFAQSLRNPESVTGQVFPADLYVGAGAGAPGVPVATSDQGVLAAEFRPAAGFRIIAQAWVRDMEGVVMVAPTDAGPFAEGAITAGSGWARGLSLETGLARSRWALTASYGLQQVRFEWPEGRYDPGHGTTHLLETGVTVLPARSLSLRLGITGAMGRRTTAIAGGFEWEACNLLDRGCEFQGSPEQDANAPGGTRLPGYLRFDLGVRKEWQLAVGQRQLLLSLFGTVTNLLDRTNVLTLAPERAGGRPAPVTMRPFAPLVVGLDWRL